VKTYKDEIKRGDRFGFGRNWDKYLSLVDNRRIEFAENSLRAMLDSESLEGRSFVDIGSGSGLFSLAARRLGASVYSFDYDEDSVMCTGKLREKFFDRDPDWEVSTGSILDSGFVSSLGMFDIVYSWGVLHHTGAMWDAIENAASLCGERGQLFIAIYNDQGWRSRAWTFVKKLYNKTPRVLRPLIVVPAFIRLWGPTLFRDLIRLRPFDSLSNYDKGGRGMSAMRDLIDWVGGYPFEVAKPEEIFDFLSKRGFVLEKLKTCGGGIGCNEFVFRKKGQGPTR
jgi:2-polyprenyl-6-hydroxyphenyl methylase/3-demethylubiquinone-9 3-methyltransferase